MSMKIKIVSDGLNTKIIDGDVGGLIRGVRVVEWRHDASDMVNPQIKLTGYTDTEVEVIGEIADMPELEALTLQSILRESKDLVRRIESSGNTDCSALSDALNTWDRIRQEVTSNEP